MMRTQTKVSSRYNAVPPQVPMPMPTFYQDGYNGSKIPVPPEDFDEYGAELEPDARVWKAYVKEADKFDMEQVEGWNRSLDVTLIFAALFTAICTAFVIESSKNLKEDPAETTARRLDQIANILLIGRNLTDPSQSDSADIASPEPFSLKSIDLCVNVLWFFSLILSAAVSLIAMLAKEWCYLFMSGRIGDPWSQTKRRQQRWEGIEKWKMEQVIVILPSFIHLSFLSFAVGLCLYLGTLHMAIAVPAAFVTTGAMFIYVASTLLPLLDRFRTVCPYSTSISRLVQQLRMGTKSAKDNSEQTTQIAVKALAWLIKTSEDPKSTDIALQAIAGADPNNAAEGRELLKEIKADSMVSRRLIGLDSYLSNYEQLLDLYTRAQAFFQPSLHPSLSTVQVGAIPDPSREKGAQSRAMSIRSDEKGHPSEEKRIVNTSQKSQKSSSTGSQNGLNRELQKKIRDLRDKLNMDINAYVTATNHIFISTPDNIQALRVGSTAASHCLKSLKPGMQVQTEEQFNSAVELLEKYRARPTILNTQEIQYLMIGTAMLLSSLLVECPQAIGAGYVMSLIRMADRGKNGQNPLRLENLSLPLVVFALSQYDYPGWTQPPSPSSTPRMERAIEVIAYYVSNPKMLSGASSTMINLGLLELLSDPIGYSLGDTDIVAISEAFDPVSEGDQAYIHTWPEKTPLHSFSQTVRSMATMVSNERSGVLTRESATVACLTVLNRTGMDQSEADGPLGEVYAFVVECVLDLPVSGPEAYGQNSALDLMRKFHDPKHPERRENLTANLPQSLEKRDLSTRLKRATELGASDDASFVIKLFATGQAWFLIDLALRSGVTDDEDWRRCLSSFVGDETLWESPELAITRLEEWRGLLAEWYKSMFERDRMPRHSHFGVLLTLIASTN